MKCPACDRELAVVQVGAVEVDVCQNGCGGVWFDAFELKRVDEEHERAGDHLLQISRDPQMQLDRTRKRNCPRCTDIKLKRHHFSRTSQVEVDHCPNCAGYWLDADELQRIRAEQSPMTGVAATGQQLDMATIRYLYRVRLAQRPAS